MDYSKPTDDGQKNPAAPPPVGPHDVHPVPPTSLHVQGAGPPTRWTTGLFDCFEDVPNSIITCFCPCITFGQVAEVVDRGSVSCGASGALYTLIAVVTGWPCMYSCFYRTKMRRQYELPEIPCPDILAHCCCEPCALAQEYRELKNRGFDMTLGWDGNADKQNKGVTTAPVVEGGMNR
ncbi:protein PLANT CADMIUM RESISTANCE 2-like [Salvia hispanica]|uniref:protein PLANT CADMIUM RESISTANCE 2-like n=1 Tax=Salvia hispanica TaxID=49212 RepID=UPI0020091D55|nr:protein PLANT CADMIUM RESISTANCE 2-like [Salvia hispanica]